jgi:RNA polymerase sigma factor (sigma-70 family)
MGNSAAARRLPRRQRTALLLRVASDERLVEYVRDGSEAAFEAIYDRHHRGILAFCRHMLASPDEAEDALQHTFMSAYRHLAGGPAAIQLRPWLYTIARNRCLSMLRARRERPLGEHEEPATDNLSAEAQRRSDVRELLGDVARLPEEQRAALVLSELGAVSHDEIGQVLGVPREKVKALVFQARTSLAASRKARETPCQEIREQLATLRGGALRRTTLHRHLRECPGCREFRDEVALQRKALAVALPVAPTLGLKEAALGAAFGSAAGGGGGAAAVSGGGALVAKALVAVALAGGGTTATLEVAREAEPAPAASAAEHSAPAATLPAGVERPVALWAHAQRPTRATPAHGRHGRAASPAHRGVKRHGHAARRLRAVRHGRGRAAVPPGHAKQQAALERVPPGQAKRRAVAEPPGRVKRPLAPAAPGRAVQRLETGAPAQRRGRAATRLSPRRAKQR